MATPTMDPKTTLRLERTFDCTPERLWAAWTDPAQYARWLNPAPGHDLIMHEWDLRPGGRVRFDMPQPDGNLNPQEGVFHELDPPRRLVTGNADKSFLIEAMFEPVGKSTRLVVVVNGLPEEWHSPATIGWNAGFEKLEALVTGRAPPIETRTLTLERVFDCTPQELWDAWTKPELLTKWFGPLTTSEVTTLEPRSGGALRLAMIDENGNHHPVHGTFRTLEPPHRLVFTAEALEIGEQVSTVTIEFEPLGKRTRLRLHQDGLPAQVTDATGEGWRLSWDKLNQFATADRSLVVTREIRAPRARVFDAFTDVKTIGTWWGPKGFKTTTKQMDVRPGGLWIFTMHGPDGTHYPNWVRYEEVLRPERIAWAHGGADPAEEPHFHSTVTFLARGDATLVTLHSVLPDAAARDYVVTAHHALEGAKENLERLAAHVEE